MTAFWHFQCEAEFVSTHHLSFWTEEESGAVLSLGTQWSPVTLAIGEDGSKMACFSHSARCAPLGAPSENEAVMTDAPMLRTSSRYLLAPGRSLA